jgi:sterol desaturase/sphingolipid hydroxylase (fatty acid hydroxylase superfamily)
VVRHDSFELLVVAVAFAFSLALFYVVDFHVPALRRYRIDGGGAEAAELDAWRPKATLPGGVRVPRTAVQEVVLYMAPLLAFDALFPRRVLPEAAPGGALLALQVALSLALYDLLFFVCHRAMHAVPGAYRWLHAKHHRVRALRACETITLTPYEEAADVACSIVALNVCGAHPLARALYNVLIVLLLVELHSGYDLPCSLAHMLPAGVMGGPREHYWHHQRGDVHFQKFFTYLDRYFGFVQEKRAHDVDSASKEVL